MIKEFKHPKLNIYATDGYTNEKGISTYYVKFDGRMGERYEENLLIALGFEEVKDNHFGNGMMFLEYQTNVFLLNTDYNPQSDLRIKKEQTANINDWCIFQTKEQAKNFDKMMMAVWKIWKRKKENDDVSGQEYCLYYNKDRKEFDRDDHDTDYVYSFILPKFSGSRVVNQLISDLGEEELNNLLCWIK